MTAEQAHEQGSYIGQALRRREDVRFVQGKGRYVDDIVLPGVAWCAFVRSPHAHARIRSLSTKAAAMRPGVLLTLTAEDWAKAGHGELTVVHPMAFTDGRPMNAAPRPAFARGKVHHVGDIVAAVVADTSENARHAASLLQISYAPEKPVLRKEDATREEKPQKQLDQHLQKTKGDVGAALARDDLVKTEHTYSTPTETHNPMETHATIASWDAPDRLTIYDATQYVKGAQGIVAQAFGLPRDNVHVICPFVGGAFGCKGPVWTHTILAAMAAKVVNRPVRVELTRQQMFSGTGHRTPTFQTIALAATPDGKVQAIRHHSEMVTSPVGDWVETCGLGSTNVLYDAPSIEFDHVVHTVNVSQPSFMRAPGECPGTYAVECAMDELAYALKMDPLQLRLVNDSPNHPIKGIPWSTKHLRECYEQGAREFGWSRRTHEPRSMKDGRLLVANLIVARVCPGDFRLGGNEVRAGYKKS